ncbi:hypothetical protein OG393_30765 [Streptomyces sp. NBC_01216]|uniref:hypothetical protein n=1 Tax=Streptomyces sp. NBC_01216 TaxID=2903778 RepID=UPI002E156CB7|nr:hypothetical protein OG393_30765 [Streptomyces sp. NBC_01216]
MATAHRVAARRSTPHHHGHSPLAVLIRWTLRHSRYAAHWYFEHLRTSLPVTDPDRHALESPALEDAFAHLAIEHPDLVTPADGGPAARQADRETVLLAACDAWFRACHGPEQSWTPQTTCSYRRLLDDVHACFTNPAGGES